MSSRRYISVRWLHSNAEDPVLLLSELDEDRWELRKIEIWSDRRKGFADQYENVGGTRLGEVPVPKNDDISSDPEFELTDITEWDFAQEWQRRHERAE